MLRAFSMLMTMTLLLSLAAQGLLLIFYESLGTSLSAASPYIIDQHLNLHFRIKLWPSALFLSMVHGSHA